MKHNHLFFCFVLVVCTLGVVSCKQRDDLSGTTKTMAEANMLGADSVLSTMMEDSAAMSLTVVEYHFLPQKMATKTTMVVGYGIYQLFTATEMTYAMGDYQPGGFGLNVRFTPLNADQPAYDALYANGMLYVDTLVLDEQMAKVDNLNTLLATLPTTSWAYHEHSLWIDTTYRDTMIINQHIELDSTGKKIVVNDTVYKVLMLKDTIGIRESKDYYYSFVREATTLAQGGHFCYVHRGFNHDLTPSFVDSTANDYRWSISSITSTAKFSVRLRNTDAKEPDRILKFMKFKPSDGSCTIDGMKFDLVEPS